MYSILVFVVHGLVNNIRRDLSLTFGLGLEEWAFPEHSCTIVNKQTLLVIFCEMFATLLHSYVAECCHPL